ncbi:hypothetical protein BRETT_001805 [Brettanomyces bruxellensis]|uniref:NAD-specific glutamate dehydrogenase n=1 Tax=Dekkera bruxellensis TaxID=5007 RepID=A0A871QYR9_DEKBR|nr:uncharacterized protein BRETT_001805 [Brettanomyces bruxellensis]QOU18737.1 hypothetical protein BRETT_001805 [Brettanomyces bruxellensis]
MTSVANKLTTHNNFSASSFDNVEETELEGSGYKSEAFAGKKEQMAKVMDELDKSGLIPESLIEHETNWFYKELGIDDTFFSAVSVKDIACDILGLYSAKVDAFARGNGVSGAEAAEDTHFSYKKIGEDHSAFFASGPAAAEFDLEIDEKFLDRADASFRVESFVSELPNGTKLQCSFVYRCVFSGSKSPDGTIESVSDVVFAKTASAHTKGLYKEVLDEMKTTDGAVVKHYAVAASGEQRIVIGYPKGSSPQYNSALSALAKYYGVVVKRKYVENFAEGSTVVTLYIEHSEKYSADTIIYQITREASLLYCIPNNTFHTQFVAGKMSAQECIFAHCGAVFVTHFLNRLGPEYSELKKTLKGSTEDVELLARLKERLTSETYSPEYISECVKQHLAVVRRLYRVFMDTHYTTSSLEKTLSYKRASQAESIDSDDQFDQIVEDECATNKGHALVLRALYTFTKSILKTNFFVTSKLAISFRLRPTFLPKEEYPNTPFGMFFVVGSDFRGFHVRFRDIARGGIRIVKSASADAYAKNRRTMFDENYGLASTQQRKNKDIPEGGCKGVILLDAGSAQNKVKECFQKYIDAILDLLIKDPAKEKIVDLYGEPEMLFMGPDENTADLVDWATLHAKKRGAKLGFPWKAFFTGKSPELGGIPHDKYGMTTLSVREYITGTYKKLGITDWSKINKLQMAGGDGDLGSNEIKFSGDERYVGLVDGFGAIVDEDGIDKKELLRLAEQRLGNNKFDRSKLGPKGYAVMIDENNVKTPGGKVIKNGLQFRNNFHLMIPEIYPRKDFVNLFVPCGGRPASINANNVHLLLDDKTGKSIVPIIVEGANLFITQPAKIILEKAGAVVFKDASTNKGGVTSSSMEVLAALSLDDDQFKHNMCLDAESGELPAFYKTYVKQDEANIVEKAKLEFNLLWKLKEETGKTFSELSDTLSVAINTLADQLRESDELWKQDLSFRNHVIAAAVPPVLLQTVGIDALVRRIPDAYLKAMFATKLAGEFVYTRGVHPNPATFLQFISELKEKYEKV